MSIELMTKVWSLQDISSTQKLVLLALSDSANDDGICYPSVAALMKKCSLSDRGVQKCLAELQGMGFITKKMRSGHSTVYVVTPEPRSPLPPNEVHPEPSSPPNVVHPTPERRSPPPPNHVHPTPERRSPRNVIETKVKTKGKHITPQDSSNSLLKTFGIDGDLAKDFIAHRKAKKATVTKTVLDGFQREADKAGISIADAVRISIERGWVGFKAEWHNKQTSTVNAVQPAMSKAQRLQNNNANAFQRFLEADV